MHSDCLMGKKSTKKRGKNSKKETAKNQLQAEKQGFGNGKNPNLSGTAEPGKPVKYQKFEILDDMIGRKGRRQCTKCEKFAEAWVEAEQHGISREDVMIAVEWTINRHQEFHEMVPRQLALFEKAYTFLHWEPPMIHLPVNLNRIEERKEFEAEFEKAKQSESNIRHIWVCYREQEKNTKQKKLKKKKMKKKIIT